MSELRIDEEKIAAISFSSEAERQEYRRRKIYEIILHRVWDIIDRDIPGIAPSHQEIRAGILIRVLSDIVPNMVSLRFTGMPVFISTDLVKREIDKVFEANHVTNRDEQMVIVHDLAVELLAHLCNENQMRLSMAERS